jgi:Pvc16 N-terminal domain
MIQDVDEALRTLVRREALPGADVDVAFDAPTKDWSSRRNAPTVDLYLYDIREDLQRREVMWQAFRNTEGFQTSRQPPPRHYKLSYLVTAWTQRPEDEHRLLSAVLTCFVRHERLPEDMLPGSLAGGMPVYATIALPPPQDRPLSDVWSALGGELKPSLDLVVIAPLVVGRIEIPAPPVMELPRFDFTAPRTTDLVTSEQAQLQRRAAAASEAWEDELVEAEARAEVGPGASAQALARARERIRARLRAEIEAEAVAMAGPNATPQSLEVARQRAGARARERALAAAAERLRPEETIRSGQPNQPGRTIRLRVKRDREQNR